MLDQNILYKQLHEQFGARFSLTTKRPNIYQVRLPLYHEDGDMLEVYLENAPGTDGKVRVTDYAMTLMRLSYDYEIDTENKERIFQQIVSQNGLNEEDGSMYLDTTVQELYPAIMQFAQTVNKVGSMRYFGREVIKSLFYEQVDEFIMTQLQQFRPEKSVSPISERPELEADYAFYPAGGRAIYLFAVKDASKAKIATINCLEFERAGLSFGSMAVHQDFDILPKRDRSFLTNACDKQFTTLPEFKAHATQYLQRQAS